jgi:hypothetical protein
MEGSWQRHKQAGSLPLKMTPFTIGYEIGWKPEPTGLKAMPKRKQLPLPTIKFRSSNP